VRVQADVADGVFSRSVGPLVTVAIILGFGCFGLSAPRLCKFVVWAQLLDGLRLRGDERVLDIGCGRGALLMMAGQHLATGHAVGIDLWKTGDQ